MERDFNNEEQYQNFRIFGIGKLSEKQIERRANRAANKASNDAVKTETLETANITDEYIKSQTSDTGTNYIPYIAVGGVLFVAIIGIIIYKSTR